MLLRVQGTRLTGTVNCYCKSAQRADELLSG